MRIPVTPALDHSLLTFHTVISYPLSRSSRPSRPSRPIPPLPSCPYPLSQNTTTPPVQISSCHDRDHYGVLNIGRHAASWIAVEEASAVEGREGLMAAEEVDRSSEGEENGGGGGGGSKTRQAWVRSKGEVTKTHREMARLLHPDKWKETDGVALDALQGAMQKVTNAKDVLTDLKSRYKYNMEYDMAVQTLSDTSGKDLLGNDFAAQQVAGEGGGAGGLFGFMGKGAGDGGAEDDDKEEDGGPLWRLKRERDSMATEL